MPFDQGQFDFDAPADQSGWKRWREQLELQKKAFESRWGVSLGKRVTVSLRHHRKPISGRLEWLDQETPRSGCPTFRIGTVTFSHQEIESMVRDD